jgi:hypothetical protein
MYLGVRRAHRTIYHRSRASAFRLLRVVLAGALSALLGFIVASDVVERIVGDSGPRWKSIGIAVGLLLVSAVFTRLSWSSWHELLDETRNMRNLPRATEISPRTAIARPASAGGSLVVVAIILGAIARRNMPIEATKSYSASGLSHPVFETLTIIAWVILITGSAMLFVGFVRSLRSR